jgi:hypothetical protein
VIHEIHEKTRKSHGFKPGIKTKTGRLPIKKLLRGGKRWKLRRWEDRKVGKMDGKTIYNCPKGIFVLPFYPSSLQPFLLYPLAAGGKEF